MSALHKFKEYFGMVPMGDPLEDDGYLDDDHRDETRGRDDWRDRRTDYADEYAEDDGYRPGMYTGARRGGFDGARGGDPERRSGIRGPLGGDSRLEPLDRPHLEDPSAPAKIVTLRPADYSEARIIGEQFRDGAPVIMDLVEMSNADAKRLVDFAAGLAFALRGSFDKVATKVFILSPAGVDVSAEERRRIVETGFRNQR